MKLDENSRSTSWGKNYAFFESRSIDRRTTSSLPARSFVPFQSHSYNVFRPAEIESKNGNKSVYFIIISSSAR